MSKTVPNPYDKWQMTTEVDANGIILVHKPIVEFGGGLGETWMSNPIRIAPSGLEPSGWDGVVPSPIRQGLGDGWL